MCTKNEVPTFSGSKVIIWTDTQTDRWTDRHTDRLDWNYYLSHTRMVKTLKCQKSKKEILSIKPANKCHWRNLIASSQSRSQYSTVILGLISSTLLFANELRLITLSKDYWWIKYYSLLVQHAYVSGENQWTLSFSLEELQVKLWLFGGNVYSFPL